MARVIIETEQHPGEEPRIVMDEHVSPIHLESDPGAAQFVERVAWAVQDAEAAQPS